MRTESQLLESIQRFQPTFGTKKRPTVRSSEFYDERVYMPINFLRQPFSHPTVGPDDVTEDRLMTEYEYTFANRPISCDDFVSFSAPWRGVPWLEACCGCEVRYSEGSLAPAHFVEAPEELADLPIPRPMSGSNACGARRSDCKRSSRPIAGSALLSFAGVPMCCQPCSG